MTGGHGPTEDRDKRVTLTLETSLRAAVRSHSMGSAFTNGVRATDTAHVRPELGTPRGGTRSRARHAMGLVADVTSVMKRHRSALPLYRCVVQCGICLRARCHQKWVDAPPDADQ